MTRALSDIANWSTVAQGSYALFDATQSRKLALIGNGTGDFSSAEADRFLGVLPELNSSTPQGFDLRHHQPNDSTGFSASVFFDRSTNRYVLGIRGTESAADVVEDVRRIGIQGYAGDQLVSLYRYYRRLTTAPGQAVNYSDSEVALLNSIRLGVLVDPNFVTGIFRRSRFRTELAADVGIAPLDGSGTSVLPRGAPLVVTGHSLGGHLALLFGRLFPEVTDHVYTYNAPGVSRIGELGLWALGIPPLQASRVTNVASVMGEELISRTWSKPGENVGVFTEAGSPLYQHSIVPLTDSLALYGAFATLSPGLAGDPAAVSGIISAASPYSEDSLEIVLDELSAALGVDGAPTLIARSLSDLAARDSYYENLYALLDARSPGRDYRIESLVGKPAGELASMAAADVGVRFALNELMPFAVKNADFSSFEDSFSGQWLASRAELLAAMLDGNLVDRVFGLSGSADNVLFRDLDSGLRYSILDGFQGNLAVQISALADRSRLQQFLDTVAYNRTVVFGSDSPGEGDQLLGLSGGDRLFGAAGEDTLDGAGGDDYLEGGQGDDRLLGGAGDDTLQGGAGSDRLEGGEGSDTYILAANLDADTIVDRDGAVYAGSALLTGGSGGNGGVYVSSDGNFRYAFSGNLSSQGTLVVNDALRVEGFRNGDLGIRLTRAIDRPGLSVPVTEIDLFGDFEYHGYLVDFTRLIGPDQYGNPTPAMIAVPVPGRAEMNWEFPGTPGNTHFVMGGGNDRIEDMLGGDDYLELGTGDDAGWGGSGNDVVEGGAGRDVVAGGRGDDVLYAGSAATLAADLDDEAIPVRSDGGDLLSGGAGDDTIFGDAEANLIEGGAGRDRIFGGAGDDWIGSEISVLAGGEEYQIHTPNNDWVNRTVDVLWGMRIPATFSLETALGFGYPGIARINTHEINPQSLPNLPGDADEIDAGSGNDTIFSGAGNDIIFGGKGNDYIHVGTGTDTVFAGDGDDYVLAWQDSMGDYIDAGNGDDRVDAGGGDDVIFGGGGNDVLYAGGGNDVLFGGAGNDILYAYSGNIVLDGGTGNDSLGASASPGEVIRLRMGRGCGTDNARISASTLVIEIVGDVSPQEVSVARVERTIPARDGGGPAFETITGILISIGANGDSLYLEDLPPEYPQRSKRIEFADGTAWDEAYLNSLLAPDESPDPTRTIAGTAAGDPLYGTAGPDIFSGSQGDDWQVGAAGDDVYLYAAGGGFDLIEDTDRAPGNMDVLRFGSGILAQQVDVFATGRDYVLTAGAGGVRLRGGRTPDGAIERIEFSDGTHWSAADLEARAEVLPDNRAPLMPTLLGGVTVRPGSPVEVAIPRNAISDPDRFDALHFYAISADGERLPEWLRFDASSLTVSGTPAVGDAGPHELLLIAADSSGAAAYGSLTITVGGGEAVPNSETTPQQPPPAPQPETQLVLPLTPPPAPQPETPPAPSLTPPPALQSATPPAPTTEAVAATDMPAAQTVLTPARREEAASELVPRPVSATDAPKVGVPADPLFRDMQRRFDVLLQTGRTNLGERYAEAIREFEERRLQREEPPSAPPPSDEEVAAWNSAMHAWHDRNPGFAETDLGGNDGTWTMGWGLPGPGESAYGGSASAGAPPGLANPMALSRLAGAAAAPMLGEGLREIR